MRKSGFLRAPNPASTLRPDDVPAGCAKLAEQAAKLFETRRLVWKVNLTLMGILVVSHLSLKLLVPGFAAAQYLGIEIGLLEGATMAFTRRMAKKEERLRAQFLEASRGDRCR
jgi:hypothetical protein